MNAVTDARERYRAAVEEVTRRGLSVDDPLPDMLAAVADEHGIPPHVVLLWIHDQPRHDLSSGHLVDWCRRWGLSS